MNETTHAFRQKVRKWVVLLLKAPTHDVSGDLTGGSPSTSVTVYTKHAHVMFNQQTVSSLQTLGTLKENELPKNVVSQRTLF